MSKSLLAITVIIALSFSFLTTIATAEENKSLSVEDLEFVDNIYPGMLLEKAIRNMTLNEYASIGEEYYMEFYFNRFYDGDFTHGMKVSYEDQKAYNLQDALVNKGMDIDAALREAYIDKSVAYHTAYDRFENTLILFSFDVKKNVTGICYTLPGFQSYYDGLSTATSIIESLSEKLGPSDIPEGSIYDCGDGLTKLLDTSALRMASDEFGVSGVFLSAISAQQWIVKVGTIYYDIVVVYHDPIIPKESLKLIEQHIENPYCISIAYAITTKDKYDRIMEAVQEKTADDAAKEDVRSKLADEFN